MVLVRAAPPSYHQGYARSAGESLYPWTWNGLKGAWIPALGQSGTDIRDVSGYRNNGTLVLMDPLSDYVIGGNFRLPGFALDFDASNDRIDIPDSDLWTGGSQATWSTWLKPDANTVNLCWLMKGTYSTSWTFALQWSATFGGITIFVTDAEDDTGANHYTTSDVGITVDTWYHIVVVFNGSNDGSTRVQIYVDGFLVSGSEVGTLPAALVSSDNELRIGEFTGIGRNFSGNISSVTIYDRAWTANEVLFHYRVPLAPFLRSRRIIGATAAAAYDPSVQLAAGEMGLAASGGMVGHIIR